jgi:hypothetical protein
MLGSVATTLESELGVLKTLVSSLLDGLEQNIGPSLSLPLFLPTLYQWKFIYLFLGRDRDEIEREKLKQLLLYSRRLSAFNSRALLVQRCLDEILENGPSSFLSLPPSLFALLSPFLMRQK